MITSKPTLLSLYNGLVDNSARIQAVAEICKGFLVRLTKAESENVSNRLRIKTLEGQVASLHTQVKLMQDGGGVFK